MIMGGSARSGLDGDGAAGAPVRAVLGTGEQFLVHQVAPQRHVVVVEALEDLVDGKFRVAEARLEGLRDLIEQEKPSRALGGHDRYPAAPHVAAKLAWQVAVEVHRRDYAPG